MKKDRSNLSLFSGQGFGLSKTDILRGRSNFKRLFEGETEVHAEPHVSVRYYTFTEKEGTCKMGFIVAKRLGKANKRNYIKRIFREAYRMHRAALLQTVAAIPVGLHGAFLAKTTQINFKTAEKEISILLERIVNDLQVTFDL